MQSARAKGDAFEALVADRYGSLGYTIKRHADVLGQEVDILAVLQLPDGQSYSLIVECKYHHDRSSGNADVQSIAGAFHIAKARNVVQACVVVAPTGFSQPAQQAAAAAGIHLITQDELERLTFAVPMRYALLLRAAYEREHGLLRTFVPGHARKRPSGDPVVPLADYFTSRITAASPTATVMLGALGTGKTTHCYALARQLANSYLAGSRVPLGIYIPLERFTRHREARYFEEFVVDYLRTMYRMNDVAWSDIQQWLLGRTAIFILDGFDEISRMYTETAVADEFRHIIGTVGHKTATLLSCRTTLAAMTAPNLPAFFDQQFADLGHDGPEIVEVDFFTPADVIAYVNAVGTSAKRLLKRTSASPLLQRPLLLNTVVGALGGRLPAGHVDTAAALIDYSVSLLLKHKTNLRQAGIHVSEWRTFLEECALTMMLNGTRQVVAGQLVELVGKHFVSAVAPETLRLIEFDASVRTVLDFDIDSRGLRWSHAVFRDYLAACAIARRLIIPRTTDLELDGRFLSQEQVEFVQHSVAGRTNEWKAVVEFRRPRPTPRPISKSNAWKWVSPGLSLISDVSGAGARLSFFEHGFWISEQPITFQDLQTIGLDWVDNDQRRLNKSRQRSAAAPVTYVTHEEAAKLAALVGGRLPTESEWERAACWIDGSYPRGEVIPNAEPTWQTPPLVTGTQPNPWGVRNAVGCVWQWTSTFDTAGQRYICRGPWWGATDGDKRKPIKRLVPNEPDHVRTGVRLVKGAEKGGSL